MNTTYCAAGFFAGHRTTLNETRSTARMANVDPQESGDFSGERCSRASSSGR